MAATAVVPSRPAAITQVRSNFSHLPDRIVPHISSYLDIPNIWALARTCKLHRRQILYFDTLWRDIVERSFDPINFRLPSNATLIALPMDVSTLISTITRDLRARNSSSFNWTAIRNQPQFRYRILALISHIPMPSSEVSDLSFLQQADFCNFLHSIVKTIETENPQIYDLMRECLHWMVFQKILSRLASRFIFRPPPSEAIHRIISQLAEVVTFSSGRTGSQGLIGSQLSREILRRFPDLPSLLTREHERRIHRVRETERQLAFLIPHQMQEPLSLRTFSPIPHSFTDASTTDSKQPEQSCSIM